MIWAILTAALSAYLLGNLNGAVSMSVLLSNEDVRTKGSGNSPGFAVSIILLGILFHKCSYRLLIHDRFAILKRNPFLDDISVNFYLKAVPIVGNIRF